MHNVSSSITRINCFSNLRWHFWVIGCKELAAWQVGLSPFEGTLCRPYSKYVWWHSCKSFSSSPNQDAAMAAACKWPSCQKQNRLSILIGLLSWINLPYLVSPSKITILKIFTEVLKPKPVTTETVTIDTRTFLEDSNNLYRVALAEKKPRLWSSLAVCAC